MTLQERFDAYKANFQVNPDYTVRPEPAETIAVLKNLRRSKTG